MATDDEIRAIELVVDDNTFSLVRMFPTVNETWIRNKLYEKDVDALTEEILMNFNNDQLVPKRQEREDFDASSWVENAVSTEPPDVFVSCGICDEYFDANDRVACQSDAGFHIFCRTCVEGHVQACIDNGRLARKGQGVSCLDVCDSYIAYADFKRLVTNETLQRVDVLLANEAINATGIVIERCKECDNPQTFDYTQQENLRFLCFQCGIEFCRNCRIDWKDHVGRTCAQLTPENERNRKNLENQLTYAVTRKCPNCQVLMQKFEGCDSIRCKCGTTFCYSCGRSNGHDANCRGGNVNTQMAQRREQLLRDNRDVDEETRNRLR